MASVHGLLPPRLYAREETDPRHCLLWYHPDSIPGTDDLQPELYMTHLRIFLPSLRADEVVAFQNLPQFRSVPQMAHAHVFLRPQAEAIVAVLQVVVSPARDNDLGIAIAHEPWKVERRATLRRDT